MNALVSKKIFLGILCIKGWSNDSDVGKERLLKVWIFWDNDGCELYLFFEAIIINYGKILNIKYFKEKHVKCNVICKNIKHMKGIYAEIEMEYINLWQILFIRDDLLKLN